MVKLPPLRRRLPKCITCNSDYRFTTGQLRANYGEKRYLLRRKRLAENKI